MILSQKERIMSNENFGYQKLNVWKKADEMAFQIYMTTKKFPKEELFGLTSQLRRASLSVPTNIAEGYERDSIKSCVQYLTIAKGSCGELWTQLLIGRKAGLVTADPGRRLEKEAREISKMLFGLIKHYKEIQNSLKPSY